MKTKRMFMSLEDLVSARFCPITGQEIIIAPIKKLSKAAKQKKRAYTKKRRKN